LKPRSSHPPRFTPFAAGVLTVAALTGCSSVSEFMAGDKVDYRSASTQTQGLEIPPDLTQLSRNERLSGGIVSASSMLPATQPSPTMAAPALATPSGPFSLRIERLGNQRWLSSSLSPEQVWPLLLEFWKERGLNIESEQADIGVMETEWSENRAKLPQDFLRKSLGKVLDGLYSTGERDKFRTRIERTPSGGSEIFISHRGMIEVYTHSRSESTTWQARPNDPQLEAIFLQRLMIKLGFPEKASQTAVASTPAPAAKSRVATDQHGNPILQIDESFDRAWRQVGLSLDRSGFTVEDRDRAKGLYFVRYIDPQQLNKEPPGLFAKLFSKSTGPALEKYRVQVQALGTSSRVTVQTDQGAAAAQESAKRILNLLAADLK